MKLSKLQLGTVQFGLDYGIANKSGKPSYEKARDILKTAFEGGINSFDTAAAYGNSEEVLGKAIEELKLKEKTTIVTKIPSVKTAKMNGNEAKAFIFKTIESSLEKLRLEKLSICLFHHEEDIEYMPILLKARESGLVEQIGVSIDSDHLLQETLLSGADYIQLPFNIMDKRMIDSGFFQKIGKTSIKIFSRSVYLQGLLLMPEENIMSALNVVLPARKRLCKIAEEAEMKMPELCMRYVLSFPEIESILTGVDSIEQLKQNLRLAAKGPLDENILLEIKKTVPLFDEKILRPLFWPKKM